jgi:hypothetical protein
MCQCTRSRQVVATMIRATTAGVTVTSGAGVFLGSRKIECKMPNNLALLWRRDPRDTSSIRAEVAYAGRYELVAFHLAAANGQPQHFGWEIFGGVRYATRLSGGSCRTFAAAKRAAETAFHVLSK